jgi:hypothetical protein
MARSRDVDRRRAVGRIATAAIACCALHAVNPAFAADKFRRLSATEIRTKIIEYRRDGVTLTSGVLRNE